MYMKKDFDQTGMVRCAGKLVLCRVTGIAYKRPQGEQLDQANPNRNDETGLWECPFCHKDDFPELSEVCDVFPFFVISYIFFN